MYLEDVINHSNSCVEQMRQGADVLKSLRKAGLSQPVCGLTAGDTVSKVPLGADSDRSLLMANYQKGGESVFITLQT